MVSVAVLDPPASTDPLNIYNVAQLQGSLADDDKPSVYPFEFPPPSPIISYVSYDERRMSSSANSTAETESSVASRAEKRPLSPSNSPPPKRRPVDNNSWDIDSSSGHSVSGNADEKIVGESDPEHLKVHLPSISTSFEDSNRAEYRRASLPTLHSESSRIRHAPYPSASTRAAMNNTNYVSSSLSSYTFPSQHSGENSDRGRPRLDIGGYSSNSATQNNYDSPYSNPGLSSTTGTPLSSSQYSFGSPLQPDYHPRSSTFPDNESWGHNNPSHIVRPNSTPGHLSSPAVKYEDTLRHTSFSTSPMSHMQMFAGSTRISGQQDRVRPYGNTSSAGGRNDWSFPSDDYGMQSGNYGSSNLSSLPPSSITVSSNISPRTSPASAPIDGDHRPPPVAPRKRGKLPKETTDYLKAWLHRHSDHPYPSEEEKKQLCLATGLSMSQVSNWMINARRRILAPVARAASANSPSSALPSYHGGRSGPPLANLLEARRQSMPTDNLQLYHPMTLQSMPNTPSHHHQSSSDYVASGSRGMLGGPAMRSTYSSASGEYGGRNNGLPLLTHQQHSPNGGYASSSTPNQFSPMYPSPPPQQQHNSADNGFIASGTNGSSPYGA